MSTDPVSWQPTAETGVGRVDSVGLTTPTPHPVLSDGSSSASSAASAVDRTNAWRSRMSLNQMTTPRWSLEEDLTRYAEAGVSGIGINWQKLDDDSVPTEVARIRQSRLRVSSVGWCGGFTGAGHTYKEALLDARRKLRVAGQLGAATLVVITGPQSTHIRKHAARLTADAISELCDAAEGSDVQIGLQPMHDLFRKSWSFVNSLDESLAILDRVGDRRAKLCFGTYHLWQEFDLLRRTVEIASRIASVQLSDWRDPPRCENDRLLPGDGCIPLADIIDTLESAGYRGWYEMEIWSRDLWKQDHVDLIDACVRRFDQLQITGTSGLEST